MATELERLQKLIEKGVADSDDLARYNELKTQTAGAVATVQAPMAPVPPAQPSQAASGDELDREMTFAPDRIPNGIYKVMGGAEFITTKEGKNKIVIRWVISEGEYRGKDISDFYDLSPEAQFRIHRTLNGLKITPDNQAVKLTPRKIVTLLQNIEAQIVMSWDSKFFRMVVDEVYKPGTVQQPF